MGSREYRLVKGRWNISCKTCEFFRKVESRAFGEQDRLSVLYNSRQVVLGVAERLFLQKIIKKVAISKTLHTFASLNEIKSVLALRHEVISWRFGVGVFVRGVHRNEPPYFCY